MEVGYTHIDTADIYGNEAEIGEAIAESRIDRKDLYLTTKIWNSNRNAAGVKQSVEQSLKKLKTDYLDLLLIHGRRMRNNLTIGKRSTLKRGKQWKN